MVTFTARRSKPEVVVPARATPREVKSLSDVDNMKDLRQYATIIEFFRCVDPQAMPEQLASFLKAGLAEALVHYYPVAGRVRELPDGKKLVVDCTAEGAVFVEAHANVSLEEFGKPVVAPYPCVDELLCDVGDVKTIFGKPLLYLQMTRLKCGGIVLGLTTCHSVVDAAGMVQILRCILDLARGQTIPAVLPVWERHLLVSSSVTDTTTVFDTDIAAMKEAMDAAKMAFMKWASTLPPLVARSFLFGTRELAAIRSRVPAGLAKRSTKFDLITAVVWRCRIAALGLAPHKQVRLLISLNARGSWKRDPPLLPGFYGNGVFMATAEASVGELCSGPLARVVELVREAKLKFTDEHAMSVLDVLATGEYHMEMPDGAFVVSDITHLGDDLLDLGSWAERVGGGTAFTMDMAAMVSSFYIKCKDTNGDECIAVPMCLPELQMAKFASQIAEEANMFTRSSM